jgi:hypothetical protein
MAFVAKKVRDVTHQIFPIGKEKGRQWYFGMLGSFFLGKATEKGGKIMEPPNMLRVMDLETGEMGAIILPTVAYNEIRDGFPDGTHGKAIGLKIIAAGEGKGYNLAEVCEVEPSPEFLAYCATLTPEGATVVGQHTYQDAVTDAMVADIDAGMVTTSTTAHEAAKPAKRRR